MIPAEAEAVPHVNHKIDRTSGMQLFAGDIFNAVRRKREFIICFVAGVSISLLAIRDDEETHRLLRIGHVFNWVILPLANEFLEGRAKSTQILRDLRRFYA